MMETAFMRSPGKRHAWLFWAFAVICCLSIVETSVANELSRPNIILILADDLGYSDLGSYGGEIRTPHLDALAARGLRGTQFYNGARCCPSRASILTGLYSHRAGMGAMNHRVFGPGYQGGIHDQCVTLGDVLQTADYRTYMAGKWHVLIEKQMDQHKENWPLQRGFDRFYGTLLGYGDFYKPKSLVRDNQRVDLKQLPDDFYYTDVITDTTIENIDQHLADSPDSPFFCYVAYTAPHWPLHAKPEDIARYANTYQVGWDTIRADRHQRMIEKGIVSKTAKLTERDSRVPAWSTLSPEQRRVCSQKMAVYAAMVDCLDQGVGRIVSKLEESQMLDNTLIVFLSDNGGCPENGPFGWDQQSVDLEQLGSASSFSSYGFGWSNACNTPFREHKHWTHEGGIRTPLIVSWPAKISARNELRHQVGHIIDLMPTFIDVSGAEYPEVFHGKSIYPWQGKSLQPMFNNKAIDRDALFWEHETNCAVRQGNWKLVAQERNALEDPWELYDMSQDPTETENLAAKYPDRVKAMSDMWMTWANENAVLPMLERPAWFYDGEENQRPVSGSKR